MKKTGNSLRNGTIKDHLWDKNKKQKSKEQPDHEESYMPYKEFLFNFLEDGLLTFFFFLGGDRSD